MPNVLHLVSPFHIIIAERASHKAPSIARLRREFLGRPTAGLFEDRCMCLAVILAPVPCHLDRWVVGHMLLLPPHESLPSESLLWAL